MHLSLFHDGELDCSDSSRALKSCPYDLCREHFLGSLFIRSLSLTAHPRTHHAPNNLNHSITGHATVRRSS